MPIFKPTSNQILAGHAVCASAAALNAAAGNVTLAVIGGTVAAVGTAINIAAAKQEKKRK